MNLFRKEALNHQNDTEFGGVIIPSSFGMFFSAISTIVLLTSIILFIYFFQYTKKAHLSGIVMPSSGVIKLTPQYSGYVTNLTVTEGQHVSAGEPLYRISGERYNGQGTGTLAAMSMSLKTQYSMLASQQTQELSDNNQQQLAVQQRIASLQPQIRSAEQRLNLAEHQVQLSISVMNRYHKLVSSHYVSDIEFQQKQIEVTSAEQNAEDQRQILLQLRIST
ncbi:hypothetical protein GVv1_35810 [Enterobacter pseudoroggenkampii]